MPARADTVAWSRFLWTRTFASDGTSGRC